MIQKQHLPVCCSQVDSNSWGVRHSVGWLEQTLDRDLCHWRTSKAGFACVLCLKKCLSRSEIAAAYFEQPVCMHEYELSRLPFRPISKVRGGSLHTAVLRLVKTTLTAYIIVTWQLGFGTSAHGCHIASGSEVDANCAQSLDMSPSRSFLAVWVCCCN